MINFGMIGCGSAAEIRGGLGINLSKKANLKAVSDIDIDLMNSYADKHDISHRFSSAYDLIQNPEIHAVYIAVPNVYHHPFTIAATKAGKHVLCEKPFGISVEENISMIESANNNNVLLSVSYYRRFYESVQFAKKLIEDGEIGDITMGGLHATHFLGEHHTPDLAPRRWLIEKDKAGAGVFQRAGSHRIDLLVYLMGIPEEVFAYTDKLGEGYDVDDASMGLLKYSSGVQTFIALHHTVKGSQTDWLEICGTEGRILLDPLDDCVVVVESTKTKKKSYKMNIPESSTLPIVDNFVDAIELGVKTICPPEDAIVTNKIIYGGYLSSIKHVPIKII